MDKAQKEFETQALNMGHSVIKIDGQYIESQTIILHTGFLIGRQSRDEEIKLLTDPILVITIRDDWTGDRCREFAEERLKEIK